MSHNKKPCNGENLQHMPRHVSGVYAVLIKLFTLFVTLMSPALSMAQEQASSTTLSLTPPTTDVSVTFLGNIFGIVDGVLHGTGSQIMGTMFAVFNSAVLAVGGIIIMYVLIVSTMNTAHEGQMLGQKWSSIWIPIRTTIGLALLIPKSTGYCMMQVFFMWVVVQGVGAADKIWDAALEYLNRGGVIVKAAGDSTAISSSDENSGISNGASIILTGQVCMVGLTTLLEQQRELYLKQKDSKTGPCYNPSQSQVKDFCDNAVPNFSSTVNAVTYQQDHSTDSDFSMPMPYFTSDSIYYSLNGICGTITWNALDSSSSSSSSSSTIDQASATATEYSRAIGIQQMYSDLLNTAETMVENDPQINTNIQASSSSSSSSSDSDSYFSTVAKDQFGVPYQTGGSLCTGLNQADCMDWKQDESNTSSGLLLAGTEFQYAVSDYNAIMAPTLRMMAESQNEDQAKQAHDFISDAESDGWLMAGSYFFNLVVLNGNATMGNTDVDTNSGLKDSSFEVSNLTSPFGSNGCTGTYEALCYMFDQDITPCQDLTTLINGQYNGSSTGSNLVDPPLNPPSFSGSSHPAETGTGSSTVYGYINNAAMIQLSSEPGTTGPTFKDNWTISFTYPKESWSSPSMSWSCGHAWMLGCLAEKILKNLWGNLIKPLINYMVSLFNQVIQLLLMTFIAIPMSGILKIFVNGVSIIEESGANPILALAMMGTAYINFSMMLWLLILEISLVAAAIPYIGTAILALIMLCLPFLIAWLGIMIGIGFLTAYYVPFLPYMIFLFGGMAWFMLVVEAMAAAPLVALAVTYPEGGEALGKAEPGLMLLLNVFLRPGMMVIGFIAGFALSYVGVWMLNTGFGQVYQLMEGSGKIKYSFNTQQAYEPGLVMGYTNWAGMYACFFSIVVYTMIYITLVEKAFGLIYQLPDKVLKWIGGPAETIGQEAAQWTGEIKGKVGEGGQETHKSGQQMTKKLEATAMEGVEAATGLGGPDITGKGE